MVLTMKNNSHPCVLYILILMGLVLTSLIPLISAEVQTKPPVKQGDCTNIVQLYYNSSYQNVTTIENPQGLIYIIKKPMTNLGGGYFNYTFCNTSVIGYYIVNGVGDKDGEVVSWNYDFYVGSSNLEPDGVVIVLFILLFLILVGITCYISIYSIGHLINFDFDIIDLAFNWGLYFVIATAYFLETVYLGNSGIEKYLLWFLAVGGIFLILIPLIAFIISLFYGKLGKQQFDINIPKRIKYTKLK